MAIEKKYQYFIMVVINTIIYLLLDVGIDYANGDDIIWMRAIVKALIVGLGITIGMSLTMKKKKNSETEDS